LMRFCLPFLKRRKETARYRWVAGGGWQRLGSRHPPPCLFATASRCTRSASQEPGKLPKNLGFLSLCLLGAALTGGPATGYTLYKQEGLGTCKYRSANGATAWRCASRAGTPRTWT